MTRGARAPLLVAAILLLLAPGCLGPPAAGDPSLRHTYSYEVTVGIDRALDDLVLRLPLPSANGSSSTGEAMANGSGYGLRPGWNVSVVEVDGTPLLELRAEEFVPEYRGTPIAIVPGGETPATPVPPATGPPGSNPVLVPFSFGVSLDANRTIETRDPAGQEPLLGGGAGLSPAGCDLPGRGDGARCHRHPVSAFVDYRAGATANVSISVQAAGANEWWRGGWSSNRYADRVLLEFPGGARGWTRADATLVAGEGIYP